MSSLVDTTENLDDLGTVEKDLREAVTRNVTADTPTGGSNAETLGPKKPENVPDKFWDADKAEVRWDKMAESYTNLESTLGRMANDLGTQRKMTDKLLDLKRTEDLQRNTDPVAPLKVTSQELLDRPAETLERVVQQVVQRQVAATDQRVASVEQNLAAERFARNHPDWQKTANDAGFTSWIQASTYRTRAAASAYNGDYVAADELLTEYKNQNKAAPTGAAAEGSADATRQAARAALESGSQQGGGGHTPAGSKGKVYRRSDLIRLKVERPDVYNDPQFQDEILRAYAEDRVK